MSEGPPPPLPAPPIDGPSASERPAAVPHADPGPGTTRGSGASTDPSRARVFPCERCGADVTFDVASQRLRCPFCGHVKELSEAARTKVEEQDFEKRLASLADQRGKTRPIRAEDVHEVRCGSCGANVVFQGTLTSTHCPFCGIPVQRERVHDLTATDRIPVDGILPFQVAAARAQEILRKWVTSRWFAPGEFKRRGVDARFQGVYVPYWTFDAMTFNRYTGLRGEHYWVTVGSGKNARRVRKTRWWPAAGSFQLFFDDVLVVAAKGLPDALLQKLEPWPLARCVPFNAELMSGFLARTYDVELPEGYRGAKVRMDQGIRAETRRRIGGDEQQITTLESTFDAVTYKHVLLPVWILSYRWKEKTHRVVVNAVTGELQGTRPWSVWKIVLLVLGVAAAVAVVAAIAS